MCWKRGYLLCTSSPLAWRNDFIIRYPVFGWLSWISAMTASNSSSLSVEYISDFLKKKNYNSENYCSKTCSFVMFIMLHLRLFAINVIFLLGCYFYNNTVSLQNAPLTYSTYSKPSPPSAVNVLCLSKNLTLDTTGCSTTLVPQEQCPCPSWRNCWRPSSLESSSFPNSFLIFPNTCHLIIHNFLSTLVCSLFHIFCVTWLLILFLWITLRKSVCQMHNCILEDS